MPAIQNIFFFLKKVINDLEEDSSKQMDGVKKLQNLYKKICSMNEKFDNKEEKYSKKVQSYENKNRQKCRKWLNKLNMIYSEQHHQ